MTMTLEPPMATEDHVDFIARQEALENKVLLLCPTISWWKGMYLLPRSKTQVITDGETVGKDDATAPMAKLITDKYPIDSNGVAWKKRFQVINSRLSAIKEKYSIPFPINGVRIVPKKAGQQMMDEMYGLTIGRLRKRVQRLYEAGENNKAYAANLQLHEAIRLEGEQAPADTPIFDQEKGDAQSVAYQLHVTAREFCNNWEAILQQIRDKNSVFSQVESKIPKNAGVMRTKFSLDVVPVELAGGSTNANTIDQDDLDEYSDVVRETCRRRVEEAIEEMIESPRQQLADAISHLGEMIARDGRLNAKSFKPVYDAIAKIRMFDFVANDELLSQINAIESRLRRTQPNSLDSVTAANNGFSSAISQLLTEVQDAQAKARDLETFGRPLRSIQL